MLGHDEFGLWFVLTIDNVHLELSVILLEEVAKLDRVLYTLLKVLQKVTAKQRDKIHLNCLKIVETLLGTL